MMIRHCYKAVTVQLQWKVLVLNTLVQRSLVSVKCGSCKRYPIKGSRETDNLWTKQLRIVHWTSLRNLLS